MQVNRGNILKTTGMLCNPNFVHSRIISILITHIFTKDGKIGNACFCQAELTLCFMTMCWSSFVF